MSEKFFDLVDIFGASAVGMITGDSAVNAAAPIICCTAEILAGVALRGGADADAGIVVMDEFHYYGDPQRGWAWQVPLLELQPGAVRADVGDPRRHAVLRRRPDRGAPAGQTAVIADVERPVPLHFSYTLVPLTETLQDLLATSGRRSTSCTSPRRPRWNGRRRCPASTVATRAERDQIADVIGEFRFSPGFGRTLSRLVRHGIGVHHAGMLPKYRRLVEKLAQSGLLKVICGTDTLGVGINVPIRTVLMTALSKYDGRRTRLLSAREFHQIAGRAGRAGFDVAGDVVVLAPEHVIENERAVAKAGDDAAKKRKVVRRKPPEGFVSWSETTFDKLVAAEPEPLTSHFRVSHAMVLGVVSRPGNAFESMRRLIEGSHEPRAAAAATCVAGHRDRQGADRGRDRRAARRAGRDRPPLPADHGPAAGLRAGPAAVAAGAGRAGHPRPAGGHLCAGCGLADRGDAGGSATGAVRAAVQGPRRGGGRDEGRGHRVRGPDGAARGRRLSQAAGRPDRGRLRGVPQGCARGSPSTSRNPSRWSATCTSGR